jgi:hypothetical protein
MSSQEIYRRLPSQHAAHDYSVEIGIRQESNLHETGALSTS